jgi:hypothetical protein
MNVKQSCDLKFFDSKKLFASNDVKRWFKVEVVQGEVIEVERMHTTSPVGDDRTMKNWLYVTIKINNRKIQRDGSFSLISQRLQKMEESSLLSLHIGYKLIFYFHCFLIFVF